MFCDQCGTKLKEEIAFCPNCGKRISDEALQVVVLLPIYSGFK